MREEGRSWGGQTRAAVAARMSPEFSVGGWCLMVSDLFDDCFIR
jgi:hypothetical protein